MKKQVLMNLVKLRIIVGALGERQQPQWWASSFTNETSQLFTAPIFTKTYLLAQYHGLKAAAALVHDEYIGTGRVYHLFRLPEELEYEIQNFLLADYDHLPNIFESLKEENFLAAELTKLAGDQKINASQGPTLLGKKNILSKISAVEQLSQIYLEAFSNNKSVYPYFTD